MQCLLQHLFSLPIRVFRSRRDLFLENLALRQQLAVLKQRHSQPRFAVADKLGDAAVALARMEAGIDPCSAGDRRSLASGGVQVVLDLALAASNPCWKKMRQQAIA
jgi:hypothetical protein